MTGGDDGNGAEGRGELGEGGRNEDGCGGLGTVGKSGWPGGLTLIGVLDPG